MEVMIFMSLLTSTKVYEENNESTEEAQECEGSMRTITRVVVVVVLSASVQGQGWTEDPH